jgi:long-subunit fatty acid transport protein
MSVAALLFAVSAAAQTNDHVYRSWSWQDDPGSPRSAGLAGSFIAIADDPSAALTNPAGLAVMPRNEAMGSLAHRSSGNVGPGDIVDPSTSLGMVGGTMAIGTRWAIGAHFGEPRDLRLDLAPMALPNGTYDAGFLQADLRTYGVAAGYSITPKIHVGAGLAISKLSFDSQDAVLRPGGRELTQMLASGSDSAPRGVFGAIYEPTADLRIGLAARTGASFEIDRTAYDPIEARTVDHGSQYRLRAPDVYSAGAAYRLPAGFRVSAEADLVRHSQVLDALDVRRDLDPADYRLDDGVDGHVGLEWARPFDAWTLQLRGGVWNQAPGSIEYVGPDAAERTTFPGSSRRTLGGAGASVLLKNGVSIDASSLFGGDRTLWLAGARYRF